MNYFTGGPRRDDNRYCPTERKIPTYHKVTHIYDIKDIGK